MKRRDWCNLLVIFLFLTFSSCFKDPGYPKEPHIIFKSIKQTGNNVIDVKVNFTDGDGDLGLTDDDNLPPFNQVLTYDTLLKDTIQTNFNYNNYHFIFLFKNPDSTFKTCEDSPDICNELIEKGLRDLSQVSRFMDLNPDRKARPLAGELTFEVPILSSLFRGKIIKLKIFIQDRALNESNTILTDSLLIQ